MSFTPFYRPQGFSAITVVPNDSEDLDQKGASLYVGTGGDITVGMTGGGTATFKNVPDGTFLPIQVNRVYDTNTSASDILALY